MTKNYLCTQASNYENGAPTSRCRLHKFGAAAAIALAVVAFGGIRIAEAQEKKLKAYTFKNIRNQRFGEILIVRKTGIDIYNTTGLNDCPPKVWNALDLKKIKKQFGALKVQRNTPRRWMMDIQTVLFGEKVSFGGLEARWGARLNPALAKQGTIGSIPYKPVMPKKTQRMVYSKGKPVYELVDPDGHIYVMQARQASIPLASLAKLGDRLKKLPKGWQYRTRILTEELVIDLRPERTTYVVGDEFDQYYTRIPKTK